MAEWWEDLNGGQDQAAAGLAARDRLQALQMDERDDPYQTSARQQIAQEALQAPLESFRGYSPGWDLGDILDNPVTDAAQWGFGAAGHVLDTLGRPVRTGIDEAANLLGGRNVNPYRVLESVWNPEAATSATSLRRRLLFKDIGQEGDGATWGDVPDVLADLGVGMIADPLSYLLPGASKAGEAAAVGGRELVGALSRAGRLAPEAEMLGNLGKAGIEGLEQASHGPRLPTGNFFRHTPEAAEDAALGFGPLATPSREMAQSAAIRDAEAFAGKKFTDETGNFLPQYGSGKAPRPTFTGEEPTLYQRLASGEQNVQLGIPFTSLQSGPLLGPTAPQWAKTGLNALGAVADAPRQLLGGIMEHVPFARGVGDYVLAGPYKAMTMLAQSIPARWVGDKVQAAADLFLEPGVLNAGGRAAAEAEHFGSKLRTEIEPRIFAMNEVAQKAGLSAEERTLANGVLPHYDPENPVATIRNFEADSAHAIAGKTTPEEQFKKVSDQIALLPADKQNAIYAISQQHHAMNYRLDEVMHESGVGTGRLGDALRERLKRTKQELETVQAAELKGRQRWGPSEPGVPVTEHPVLRDYVDAMKPEARASRSEFIKNFDRTQNEGFRINPNKAPLQGDVAVAIADKIDETFSRAHGEENYLWKRLKYKGGYDSEEQIQGLIRQGISEDPAIKQLNEQVAHANQDLQAIIGGSAGDANAVRAQIDTANAAVIKRSGEIEQGVRTARGLTEQLPDGTSLIRALKGADLSTPLHELAHVARFHLPEEEMQVVQQWLNSAHGIDVSKGWTREADETYAKYFERFLKTGKAPVAELDGVFGRLKKWITEIYEWTKEKLGGEMSPEIKQHFDRLLGGTDAEGKAFAKVGPKGSKPANYDPAFSKGLPDNPVMRGPARTRFTAEEMKAMPVMAPEAVESELDHIADTMGWPRIAVRSEGQVKGGTELSKVNLGVYSPNKGPSRVGGRLVNGKVEPITGEIAARRVDSLLHEFLHSIDEHLGLVNTKVRGLGAEAGRTATGDVVDDFLSGQKSLGGLRPELAEKWNNLRKAIDESPEWQKRMTDFDASKGEQYLSLDREKLARAMEMGLAKHGDLGEILAERHLGHEFPHGEEAAKVGDAADAFLRELKPYARDVQEQVYKGGGKTETVNKTVFGLYQPSAEKVFESKRQMNFRKQSTELESKIESLQNVINVTQKKVNAIPNYTPTIISDAARQQLAEKVGAKRTPGDPSIGTPEKGFVGRAGEGKRNVMTREQATAAGLPDSAYERLSARMEKGQYKYVDRELERLMPTASPETRASVKKALMPDPLEDVPLYPHEIEETFARGGTGTAATAGRGKLEPAFAVNDVVKQAFRPEALTKLQDEMTKGLTFAKQDPIEAIAKKFYGNVLPTVTQAEMRQSFARTFQSVPVRAVNDVIAMAKEGRPLQEIEKAFKAQGYGRIEDVLAPDVWQGLKEGRLDAQDVFKPGFTPYGRVEMPDWAPKPGERGVQEAHYLSEPAAKEYAQQTAMYKDLGGTLGAIQPMIQAGLSYWKPFQTAYTLRYHIRNTISDGSRMLQMGAVDGQTMGDIAKLYNPTFWKNYASTGLNRLEPWKAVQFDVGEGARFFGGRRMVPGDEIMQMLAEKGVLSSGKDAAELFNATSKALKPGQKDSTYATGVGFLDKAKRALAYRDEANRAAAFMTFLRKGQSVDEAVINTTRTLFDYKKLSPAMDFLRKMGITPFIGWATKNIPAQVEFALRNPGVVAGVFRAAQMAQDGSLPPESMPSYLRNKLGIRMGNRKNSATGRDEAVVYGVGGIIPLLDLVEATNDPQGTITGQLAPWLKYGLDQMMDETPDEQLSGIVGVPGAIASKAYGAATGRIEPGGEKTTFEELARSLVNPASVKHVDVKRAVLRASHDSQSEERIARSKYIQTQARLNQAIATFGADDPSLEPMKRAKDMAKREFFAAKAKMDRVAQQLVRQQAVP